MEKISLCLCTYNGEKFIEEQLISILNQTLTPNEIIIYDDASKDNTVKIINTFVKKFPNIEWNIKVNDYNVGWKINFRNALNEAKYDYVFLADQDDVWKSDKIERMMSMISNNSKILLLTSNYNLWLTCQGKYKKKFKENNKCVQRKSKKLFVLTDRPGCTYLLKKEIIYDFNIVWEPKFPHDAILFKIAFLRGGLYNYNCNCIDWRRHTDNASGKKWKSISSEAVKIHYEDINTYLEYYLQLSKLENINKNSIFKVQKWLNKRKKMYETKSILLFLNLLFYLKYYSSYKAFLSDFLAITFYNKITKEQVKK